MNKIIKVMINIVIDGNRYEVQNGRTIIEICDDLKIEIPRFCYHKHLNVAANCRMCLVELENVKKPVPSCLQVVSEGMVVYTNSIMVKNAREGVMEFLLINHPLDCPVCDQGGECDLQDQAFRYGSGISRYQEGKRAVSNKDFGPLIQTHMNRCIHCTRCIRFLEDIAGNFELGAIGRGEGMEITTYVDNPLSSELSGNIIDLCPVGALTSKPYAFKARSWELCRTPSIDVMDAVGSNIQIDSRDGEVMRILPKESDLFSEHWITDKARFSYDGLKYQRLDKVLFREANGKLRSGTWDDAYKCISNLFNSCSSSEIGAIAGDFTDVETMFVMKALLQALGSNKYECRQDGNTLQYTNRSEYIFNTDLDNIKNADHCVLIGCNPKIHAPLLNSKIYRASTNHGTEIALLGEKINLNYKYKYIGSNPWLLKQIANGDHPYCDILKHAKRPMMILGSDALVGNNGHAVLHHVKKIVNLFPFINKRESWNGFNVLQRVASRVGGLDIGFTYNSMSKMINFSQLLSQLKIIFLLGADEFNLELVPDDAFVIYIGHHGDNAVYRANLILPGAAYTEKDATYVNIEGRVQRTNKAVQAPGDAKNDWEIINNLAAFLSIPSFQNCEYLRRKISAQNPIFDEAELGKNAKSQFYNFTDVGRPSDFTQDNFGPYHCTNYYLSDSISRSSPTMLKCYHAIRSMQ